MSKFIKAAIAGLTAAACLASSEPSVAHEVQPMITTPEHGAFPAGHAAQAYAVACVLERLLQLAPADPRAVQLQRIAARISINRVIAGVHYPVDLMAGRVLGQALGEYFVARCVGGKGVHGEFPYAEALDTQDFPGTSKSDDWTAYPAGNPPAAQGAVVAGSAFLKAMWNEALTCCARSGYLISKTKPKAGPPPQPRFGPVPGL